MSTIIFKNIFVQECLSAATVRRWLLVLGPFSLEPHISFAVGTGAGDEKGK
jgi:hypothetical protein